MYNHLRKKGWSEEELHHLSNHYERKQEGHHVLFVGLALIVVALIGIPWSYGILARLLPQSVLLVVLVFISVPLGSVLGILLVDIDRLDKKHHSALLIAIPLLAVVAGYLIFSISNMNIVFEHNALIAAAVYAISIAIPYGLLVKQEWNSRIGRWNT